MVDWDLVLKEVDDALAFFSAQGVKPTLRTLFYRLVSKNIIPNTKSSYKRLSEKIVEARKMGRWAWDILEDTTRITLGRLEDRRFSDDALEEFINRASERLESLSVEEVLSETFDYLKPYFGVDRWADQPTVAEVWIEKEALSKTVEVWTEYLGVPIRVNRGYASWTFIHKNVQEITKVLERHEKIIIYYLGDLDPSGMDIERFLKEALAYFALPEDRVELKRLAVTVEQVEKYKLPPRPEDAETLAKLERDKRTAKYTLDYIVELDALVAYVPEEFKRLLREAISSLWDRDTYEALLKQAEALDAKAREILDDIKAKAKQKLFELLRKELSVGV
jgi:hypothetical protein